MFALWFLVIVCNIYCNMMLFEIHVNTIIKISVLNILKIHSCPPFLIKNTLMTVRHIQKPTIIYTIAKSDEHLFKTCCLH
jgi:hypothetical protein